MELSFDEICKIEPKVKALVLRAKEDLRQNRDRLYIDYKSELSELVGWKAKKKDLRTSEAFKTALSELCIALKY